MENENQLVGEDGFILNRAEVEQKLNFGLNTMFDFPLVYFCSSNITNLIFSILKNTFIYMYYYNTTYYNLSMKYVLSQYYDYYNT